MRSERTRVASAVGGLTLLLVVMLGIRPVSTATLLAVYVLLLAAVGMASLTRTLTGTPDLRVSPFDRALSRDPGKPARPPELVRVERELTLGTSNAGHLHNRLIPMLRDVALARLNGKVTREQVGDETWELIRPDRPEPADRHSQGASLQELRRVITRLEEL